MLEVEKKGVLVEWTGAPAPDGAVPDGAVPDGAAPDGVVPDGVVPDGLALDGPAGAARGHVIICPGGGYQWHSPREAKPVARAFAARGWKPWVLYYPVAGQEDERSCAGTQSPLEEIQEPLHEIPLGTAPLLSAADAMRRVRAAAAGKPVILCGFSAGAHVAASLGVHWKDGGLFSEEDQAAVRPDALILGYPVITAGEYAHRESIEMLAGDGPAEYYSLENFVDEQTPPAFIWHTAADSTVSVQNSLLFAGALANKKVPFELHIYPYGEHGLSLATKEVEEPEKKRYADAHVAGWFGQCAEWLEEMFGGKREE